MSTALSEQQNFGTTAFGADERQTRARGAEQREHPRFLGEMVRDDLHVKTILSLANATLGVLHAASLCIHVIGRAYGCVLVQRESDVRG
jgi:hypothetical protein